MDVFATSPGTVTREYVWGPDYADEIVCQLDYSADPLGGTGVTPETYYYLQDANYNVVAVVSPGSVGVPPAVVWQYAYEPYGRVVTAEALPPPGAPPGWAPPVNRVGFQGLFLEPGVFNASNAGLSTSSMSLWCARNRFILSNIGRWLTRDPAEAAIPIITALAFNGATPYDSIDRLIPNEHYRDGLNLYEFVGSNPVNRIDPLGLEWGFDEDIDEIVGNMCGQRAAAAAAAAAQIGTGLNVAAIIGHMAFSMLPGADAAVLAVKLAMGKNVTWEDIGAAALSVGGAAIVAKYGAKFARATAGYVRKLGQRAWAWLRGSSRGLPVWRLGAFKSAAKWESQMAQRGWTPEQIDEALGGGQKFPATNNVNPGNGATRYVHPQTGRSVVVDNVTGEVLHVGGDGFLY